MAEIGLAASVLSLAHVAWAVAKGLHDLADDVGTAGEAVRIFANDFNLFVETVKTLGDFLKDLPQLPRRTETTTEELLEVALEQVVLPFQTLLAQLAPLLVSWRKSPSRMRQLGVRIQWAFSCKSKVLFYHSALNSLKSNVSLLLQVMALRAQNPRHIRFILCQSIGNTKTILQGGHGHQARESLVAGDRGANRRHLLTSSTGPASASRMFLNNTPTGPRSRSQNERQPSTETAMVVLTSPEDPEEADEIEEALTGVRMLQPETTGQSQQEDSEEQIEAYGAIRAMQKKIIRLADEATTAVAATDSVDGAASNNTTTSPATASTVRDTALKRPESTASQSDSQAHIRRKQVNKSSTERASGPGSMQNIKPEDEVIYFTDTLGTKFTIPLRLVRTWKAMNSFIFADYADWGEKHPDGPSQQRNELQRLRRGTMQTLLYAIQSGHFTVMYRDDTSDQDGFRMILTYDWDVHVRHGWRVMLVLDDPEMAKVTREIKSPPLGLMRRAQMAAAETLSRGY